MEAIKPKRRRRPGAGRPSLAGDVGAGASPQITVRIQEPEAFDRVAGEVNLTRSEAVRQLVRRTVKGEIRLKRED